MQESYLIAITGGIGSGKSIVSKILKAKGFDVYDCDSRARILMECDKEMRDSIGREISLDAQNPDGSINRSKLAEIVFNDGEKLAILNGIVHGAVKDDLKSWRSEHNCLVLFVETAILYQSGLDGYVDEVWEVFAPDDIRIERVIERNGMTAEEILARINSQKFVPDCPHCNVIEIINDGINAVLPQINSNLHRVQISCNGLKI